ncbi:hypothetical protein HYV87_03055 [Candidatus Woesearchaeota archaeon]|nr:hypothetical protein [Candidatus Woesearchaeota archaeon]MBI2582078.1 hypothetical protein [Candidatus Woesearchaeota archaeon]
MKPSTLAFIGAVSLESLLGCGDSFPQYSGSYELREFSYTDPSFAGEMKMPSGLIVTNRMSYIGNQWNHQLNFEFASDSENQAVGIFSHYLDDLTRIDNGVWPNNWYDGVEVYEEQKIYGSGNTAWCNNQYLYFLRLESIPPPEVLRNSYPGNRSYIGKDPTTGMELYESWPHPEEADFEETEWNDAVEENEGITLYFNFTRYLRSKRPGGEGYQDCILPLDSRGKESLTFTYHASTDDLDDATDIRKVRVEEIKDNQPAVSFFRKVISNIK